MYVHVYVVHSEQVRGVHEGRARQAAKPARQRLRARRVAGSGLVNDNKTNNNY